jgi:hypothetical protein
MPLMRRMSSEDKIVFEKSEGKRAFGRPMPV